MPKCIQLNMNDELTRDNVNKSISRFVLRSSRRYALCMDAKRNIL